MKRTNVAELKVMVDSALKEINTPSNRLLNRRAALIMQPYERSWRKQHARKLHFIRFQGWRLKHRL